MVSVDGLLDTCVPTDESDIRKQQRIDRNGMCKSNQFLTHALNIKQNDVCIGSLLAVGADIDQLWMPTFHCSRHC